MQLYAELAAKSRSRSIVDDAYVAALGANAGFSGDTTGISKLAKALGFDAFDGRSAVSREVGDIIRAARKLKGLQVMPDQGVDPAKMKRRPVQPPPGASRK